MPVSPSSSTLYISWAYAKLLLLLRATKVLVYSTRFTQEQLCHSSASSNFSVAFLTGSQMDSCWCHEGEALSPFHIKYTFLPGVYVKREGPHVTFLKVCHKEPSHQPPVPGLKSLCQSLLTKPPSIRQLFPNVFQPPAPLGSKLHCPRIMRPVNLTMPFTIQSLTTTSDAIFHLLSPHKLIFILFWIPTPVSNDLSLSLVSSGNPIPL